MDYLIMMSGKYLYFRKRKHLARIFFSDPIEVTGSIPWKYFSNYVFLKVMYKKLKERNWDNSGCIKVDNFCKSVNF